MNYVTLGLTGIGSLACNFGLIFRWPYSFWTRFCQKVKYHSWYSNRKWQPYSRIFFQKGGTS